MNIVEHPHEAERGNEAHLRQSFVAYLPKFLDLEHGVSLGHDGFIDSLNWLM